MCSTTRSVVSVVFVYSLVSLFDLVILLSGVYHDVGAADYQVSGSRVVFN